MIKNFKIFERNEDIDPYGEEDWGEFELNVGDIIINTSNPLYRIEIIEINGNTVTSKGHGEISNNSIVEIKRWVDNGWARIQKKMNESYNDDIDPYGEEDWYEDKELKVGDYLISKHNLAGLLTLGKKYKIENIKKDHHDTWYSFINDNGDLDCVSGEGGLKIHFDRCLNESYNDDIDPYGEENWNEEPKFKIGDIVTCIDDRWMADERLEKGKDYEVVDVFATDDEDEHDSLLRLKGISRKWGFFRFVKKNINESINSDIDPFGEEYWGPDLDYYIGDELLCIKNLIFRGIRQLFRKDEVYHIKYISPYEYSVEDDFKGEVIFTKNQLEEYFVKVTNESFRDDIDPYGEEDWNDDNIFEPGERIICIDGTLNGQLITGNEYIVISGNEEYVDVKTTYGERRGSWYKKRFKKI